MFQLPAHFECTEPVLYTKVVLAAAHLDHDLADNARRTCAPLPALSHAARPEHLRQRDIAYKKRRSMGDLVGGRYE
ncbi:hypothetical protein NKH98_25125 [Mesorhizobium sp. M0833]|uniref:hypothetical protein n=1 Tax=Mesorhizobium sp. M0833 TaxID=2957009 RepID=UPI003336ED9A